MKTAVEGRFQQRFRTPPTGHIWPPEYNMNLLGDARKDAAETGIMEFYRGKTIAPGHCLHGLLPQAPASRYPPRQPRAGQIRPAKPIEDEVDCVLAEHYGFTHEELNFITNYDIKYRMGREG